MRLVFDTQENLKREREKAFLQMKPGARFECFLKLIAELEIFQQQPRSRSNHFILKRD